MSLRARKPRGRAPRPAAGQRQATPRRSAELDDFLADRLQEFERRSQLPLSGEDRDRLTRLALVSDYAWEALCAEPTLLGRSPTRARALPAPRSQELGEGLRIWRRREALRLIALDVLAGASVERVMTATSRVAERALDVALRYAAQELSERHGLPRGGDGQPQQLACIAMGKLGGAELNFSSDIDLIFAFAEGGESDGRRSLDNEDWFARQVQRATALLAEVTEHGYCFRIDLRLRPFGSAGRLALSFDAMEQYYQREGRDWERIAWVRARPLGPAKDSGQVLLDRLRPFVYRRYLDYAAFDGLRELKARMDAEISRREWADDLKRGPGGIRELEFLVQLPQLVRGGRLPDLRVTGILPALAAQLRHGLISRAEAQWLAAAYRFLRLVENRVQMMDDQQTHKLPTDALRRERLALGLGHASWNALVAELDGLRDRIAQAFGAVLGSGSQVQPGGDSDSPGRRWEQAQSASDQAPEADPLLPALRHFLGTQSVQLMSARGRARLDRVMPLLLAAIESQCAQTSELASNSHAAPTAAADLGAVALRAPSARLDVGMATPAPFSSPLAQRKAGVRAGHAPIAATSLPCSLRAAPRHHLVALATDQRENCGLAPSVLLQRWLAVINAILRRSSYLALLSERPGLVEEATRLLGQSAWLAQLLAAAPVLLDELLDARRRDAVPTREGYVTLLRAELDHVERELEQQVEVLRRLQQGEMLRLAYGFLEGYRDGVQTAAGLADLADVLLAEGLDMALREMQRQFGKLPGTSLQRPGIVIIGYGSLGGRELNFASDLDLVCIYDEALVGCESDGPRQLDHHRYFVRLVQRLVHLLTAQTSLGPLYEIDMRLRPNGSKGLLIVGHEAFERYQQQEAWTWEQQALVRARPIAGDRRLAARFERIRGDILALPRESERLAEEVRSMRTRMRAELDRSDAARFDLKQGEGGLVDLEFDLQQRVLGQAAKLPRRPRWPTATSALIERLRQVDALDATAAERLRLRHAQLLGLGLRCTLALQPRLVSRELVEGSGA